MGNDIHAPITPHLHLFVVGTEVHSMRARENLEHTLKEENLHYELVITDVLKDYRAALDNGVLIAPTLIITTGDSRITIAGDMSDTLKLKAALAMV